MTVWLQGKLRHCIFQQQTLLLKKLHNKRCCVAERVRIWYIVNEQTFLGVMWVSLFLRQLQALYHIQYYVYVSKLFNFPITTIDIVFEFLKWLTSFVFNFGLVNVERMCSKLCTANLLCVWCVYLGQQHCGVNLLCEAAPRAVAKLGASGWKRKLEPFKPDLHQRLGEQNVALKHCC